MRAKSGTTGDEAFAALSKRQQAQVVAIETARAEEGEKVRAIVNRAHEATRKALANGVPARVIAMRLGVSPARVYQMRDNAQAYAAEVEREKLVRTALAAHRASR